MKIKTCRVDGCNNSVHAKGLCSKHYDRMLAHGTTELKPKPRKEPKKCIIPDCHNRSKSKEGYCDTHLYRFKKYGNPLHLEKLRRNNKVCLVEECDKPAKIKGLCSMHYSRLLYHGDVNYSQTIRQHPETCTITGCDNLYYAKGFCKKHYRNYKNTGDPLKQRERKIKPKTPTRKCKVIECNDFAEKSGYCKKHYYKLVRKPKQQNRPRCTISGCINLQYSTGYCQKHYERYKKHGDPNYVRQPAYDGKKCLVSGCENILTTRSTAGMCSKHYSRFKKYGDPNKTKLQRHNMTNTKEYSCWRSMIERCTDEKHPAYHRYGGRGITIYEPWLTDFIAFHKYMGDVPFEGAQLERTDNSKGYEPGNVIWASPTVNSRNRDSNKLNMEKARKIRNLYPEYTQGQIAKMFGCDRKNIAAVLHNVTWKENADLKTVDPTKPEKHDD